MITEQESRNSVLVSFLGNFESWYWSRSRFWVILSLGIGLGPEKNHFSVSVSVLVSILLIKALKAVQKDHKKC